MKNYVIKDRSPEAGFLVAQAYHSPLQQSPLRGSWAKEVLGQSESVQQIEEGCRRRATGWEVNSAMKYPLSKRPRPHLSVCTRIGAAQRFAGRCQKRGELCSPSACPHVHKMSLICSRVQPVGH